MKDHVNEYKWDVYQPSNRVKATTKFIMSQAKTVEINTEHLELLCRRLIESTSKDQRENFKEKQNNDHTLSVNSENSNCENRIYNQIKWDGDGWHFMEDANLPEPGPLTAQYIFVLDSLNFCFWPNEKLEYEQLATGLKKVLEKDHNAFSSENLIQITEEKLNEWIPEGLPQIEERIRRIQELGMVLQEEFNGLAANLVRKANGSAQRLIYLITSYLPGFRDESVYNGKQVFFYKRAQIVVADLWAAYGCQMHHKPSVENNGNNRDLDQLEGNIIAKVHPYSFYDMHTLTMFPDYRVPQLLREESVLIYSEELASKIDNFIELEPNSIEEIEIRAATVEAVEMMQKFIKEVLQQDILSVEIDWFLWQEGEKRLRDIKPHHRTLTTFY